MKIKNKRMKQIIFSLVMILMVSTIFGGTSFQAKAANSGSERMNVVFVMDDSGSMLKTDGGLLRYEAMELFMALSAAEGNYAGAVVFNDQIINQEEISEMNGRDAKNALVTSVRNTHVKGDTDIGTALYTATEMLTSQGNNALDSAIVLLTDGNTDLKNAEALDESAARKQQAINDARAKGIKVYGICLNANGTASLQEVKDVSDATGGTSVEVKSAEDLKEVFSMFYGIIFDTNTVPIAVPEPDENGDLNVEFEIPEIGVEEANIIFNTLRTNVSFELTKPDGIGFTSEELEEMVIRAKTFVVVKVPRPEGGLWHLKISGVPRDEVEINMVCNSNLKLDLTNQDGTTTVPMNSSVNFKTTLHSNGELVTDASIYNKYPVYLDITDANGNVRTEQMTANGAEAAISCLFDKAGEFDLVAYVDMNGKHRLSNTEHMTVENTPPVAEDFKVTKVKFIGKKPLEVDLNAHASDAEDAQLSFELVQTDLDKDTISMSADGSEMVIDAVKSGSGEIQMAAIDSDGAQTSFVVKVKVINLLLILLIILLVVVVIIAVLFIIKKGKEKNKRIPGDLEIMAFNADGDKMTETVIGGRGTMNIAREVMNITSICTGINLSECTFSSGPRDDTAIFACKKPFYSEYGELKKQIELPDQVYIYIYPDEEDKSTGLCLCYKKEFDCGFSGGDAFGDSFGGW